MKFDEVRFTIEEKCRYKRQVKDNKTNNMKRTIEFKLCDYSWHCIFCSANPRQSACKASVITPGQIMEYLVIVKQYDRI